MVDFTAYFDDSGHPDSENVVLVAGWLATEDQWLLFENEWKQALVDAGIPLDVGFHMTDFESPHCPLYAGWSSHKKQVFLYRLINLLRIRTRHFFSVLIPMYEYRQINDFVSLEEVVGRPYGICGRVVMAYLQKWASDYNKENNLPVVIFEDGSKHRGDLIDIFKRDGFDPPIFRDKKKVVPLQGADLLAWEYFNAFRTNEIRPSLQYILGHPGIDGKYTAKDLVEMCREAKTPSRQSIQKYGTRIFFISEKKKDRIRKIFGTPSALDRRAGRQARYRWGTPYSTNTSRRSNS